MRAHARHASTKNRRLFHLFRVWVAALATIFLVGAMSPVYATDTATDPNAGTGTTQATDPAAGTDATPPTDTSTTDPATTGTSTTDTSTTTTSSDPSTPSSPTTTTTKKTAKSSTTTSTQTQSLTQVVNNATPTNVVPCINNTPGDTSFGNFEIDGDTCVDNPPNTHKDWDGLNYAGTDADTIVDGYDKADTTTIGGGSAENTAPSTWTDGPPPNGKNDIGQAWAYSQVAGNPGHVYAYFALTNDSTSGGTGQYDVEYNQKGNTTSSDGTVSVPNRTPGDLLFRFNSTGSNTIEFADAKEYRLKTDAQWSDASCFEVGNTGAGWCTIPKPASAFASSINSSGQFFEGVLDLTILFGAGTDGCSGTFSTVNIRSVTGNAFETSSIKDVVAPLSVNTPSTCAHLVINKYDAGSTLLGGATFTISPNPLTGVAGSSLSVTDNDSHDADPTDGVIQVDNVKPNLDYTVTETAAPAGYLLPATRSQGPTHVGDNGTVTFNFHDPKKWNAPTVTKTAAGTYDASYAWSIKKEVAAVVGGVVGAFQDANTQGTGLEQDLPSGTTGTFRYRLTVTQGAETTSNYHVAGEIRVSNTNSDNMTVSLSDALSGGGTCTINSGVTTVSVPPNPALGYTAYSYDCVPTSHTAGTNTATVTWDKSVYPQNQADVDAADPGNGQNSTPATPYTLTRVGHTNETVTITDTQHPFSPAWTITWSAQGTQSSMTYDVSPTITAGTCGPGWVQNTANVNSGGSSLASDDAWRKMCVGADLTVSKNKSVSLTRTYLWQIHKTRTSAAQITSGQQADYSVTVDKADGAGFEDSGWQMTGVITVANPNDWESVTMSSLVDQYSGNNDAGNPCSITGSRIAGTSTWGAVVLTLNASETREYQYSCSFAKKPTYDGTNTATATWSAAVAHTPDGTKSGTAAVAQADWDLAATPVNKTITVTDSAYTGGTGPGGHTLGTATWGVDTPKTFTYSITWTAPPGACENKPNTATITETGQFSSASVLVCNPLDLTVSKTATGTYTRTYKWDLNKAITPPASVNVNTYDHTFDYTVSLKENGVQDSDWLLTGTITVTNTNTDSNIAPYSTTISDVPNVGVSATPSSCEYNDAGTWKSLPVTVSIASASHKDIDYRCVFSSKPDYSGGTNKATATWGNTGSANSGDVPVTFSETKSVDKTVTVVDNKVSGSFNSLGTATYGDHTNPAWNATNSDYEWTYSLPLHNTSEGNPTCQDFTNTARVLGDGSAILDTAQATATICPNPGTWKVSKTASPTEGTEVDPGDDITYTLKAEWTGGVEANGVVLVDDLSNMIPADASYVGTVGAHVGTVTDPTAGNGEKLTWNVGQLAVGATQTMSFTVHVNSDAWNVNLHNLVTSTGSDNCPTVASTTTHAECTTDHPTSKQPLLTLVKNVDNGQTGATHTGSEWTLYATQSNNTVFSGNSGSSDVTSVPVDPGSYGFDESGPTGYTSQGWVCSGSNAVVTSVSLAPNDAKTCTVTNVAQQPHLKLVKLVDNGTTGGTGVPTDWTLTAAGPTNVSGAGGAEKDVKIGDYDLSEAERADGPTGYTAGAWSCTGGGSMKDADTLSIALGDDVTCTITNTAQPSSYTVAKSSSPGDGATVKPGDTITYTLTATRTGTGVDPTNIDVIDHLEAVWAHATYLGVVGSVPAGQSVTAPTAGDKHLTWHIDQLSGTATLSFQVKVNDNEFGTSIENVVSSPGSSNCPTDTAAAGVAACVTDHYTPAYSVTKDSDPAEGSRVNPGTNVDYTLTVTNTTAHATVDGAVVVDDLSNVVNHTSDPVIQSGTGGVYSSATQKLTWTVPSLAPGASATLVYRVHIDDDAYGVTIGNVATPKPDTGGTCVPTSNTDQTPCETTHNTKDKPKLTLVKVVDNGTTDGTGAPKDWTLTATGTNDSASGPGAGAGSVSNHPLIPGVYSLAESNGPAHYTQGTWECRDNNDEVPTYAAVGAAGGDGSIMLPLDGNFTCRVTNTADTGHYTVAKVSDPTSGSEVQPGSKITYTVTAKWHDGQQMKNVVVWDDLSNVLDHATLDAVPAGATLDGTTLKWTIPVLSDSTPTATLQYTVTVDGDAWDIHLVNLVTPKSPNGTCEVDKTCTTDDHTPKLPVLTLVKHVANGLNGTATASDWTLHADGPDSVSGPGAGAGSVTKAQVHPGDYDLSESGGPSGYTAGDWTCSNSEGPVTSVTLAPNDDVTCEITNTQDTHWKVVKTSDPPSGSTVQPDTDITYTLTATHLTGADPTDVVVTDDLSDVVANATFDASQLPAGASYDSSSHILTWNVGTLSTTKALSYTVHVNPDARGVTLRNVVTAPGSDNCPEGSTSSDCTTVHPVPAWTLTKVSDPVTGSRVGVGSTVTYTLTVENTGEVLLHGATVTDDLSQVLNYATLDATPDGATFDEATSTLHWAVPDLAPGDSAQLVYSVTIKPSAYGISITNVATPDQPTGVCVTEGGCTTTQTTPPAPEPPPTPPTPPTPPQPGPPPSPPSLPDTGGPYRGYLPIGVGLVILGAGLMLAQSRRRLHP